MREIKFRAWDKGDGTYPAHMCQLTALYHGQSGVDSASFFSTKPDHSYPLGCLEREQGVLMQYTGLKDKNGVEIYEGDIVKAGRELESWLPMIGTYPVRFENGGYMWDDNWLAEMHPWQELEVIGNIYENSELLA